MKDHIHRPNDGRGARNVYVDGKYLERCVYADEERGIAHAIVYPYVFNRARTAIRHFKVRGRVYVAKFE